MRVAQQNKTQRRRRSSQKARQVVPTQKQMSEIHKVAHCTLYTFLPSLRPSSPPVQPTTCLLRTRVTVPRPLAYYISRPSTLHPRPPCPDRRPQPALIRPPHSLLAGPYSWSSAAWPVQLLQLLLRGWLQLPPGGAHTHLDGRGHAQLRGSGGGWAWARWGRGCWSEHLPNPATHPTLPSTVRPTGARHPLLSTSQATSSPLVPHLPCALHGALDQGSHPRHALPPHLQDQLVMHLRSDGAPHLKK